MGAERDSLGCIVVDYHERDNYMLAACYEDASVVCDSLLLASYLYYLPR